MEGGKEVDSDAGSEIFGEGSSASLPVPPAPRASFLVCGQCYCAELIPCSDARMFALTVE